MESDAQEAPAALSPDDPRVWVRIAVSLRLRMDAGTLKPGDRPSITYECAEWGVARQTAARAMKHLEAEGRLKRWPGLGYVVQ